MKARFLTSMSLFAMAACTQQAPLVIARRFVGSDLGGRLSLQYDICVRRNLRGVSITGDSGAGPGHKTADPSSGCQPFAVPPPMTITNGLAQFQAVGATFAGYVTPQGNLKLDSGRGATVIANFDPQTGIFRGQANSINCRYDVAWQKA